MSEIDKDYSATAENVGKYKQAAPLIGESGLKKSISERKQDTSDVLYPITFNQSPADKLFDKANSVLCWLARFPIQGNHPRRVTGTVKASIAGGEVLIVNWEEKISKVFRKLITEGFLSAPVVDKHKRFLYFVDMLDLVWHVCHSFETWEVETFPVGEDRMSKRNWASYFDLPRFADAKVDNIFGETKMQIPRLVTFEGFSTLSAIEAMLRTKQRRVILLTPDEKVKGILTLSMIMSSLDQHLDEFGQLRQISVDTINKTFGNKRALLTIRENEPVASALKLMVLNNVTSIPVLNSTGDLCDVISVRDLRGIGPRADHFERLWHPITAFKQEMRQEFNLQTPNKPITVLNSDTFQSVVRKMDDGNIHHIYIVEAVQNRPEACIPVGVLSQADVIGFVLYQCGQQLQIA